MSENSVYMIRRKTDGLYSTGGMNPQWRKNGKIWTKAGLKLHLNLFVSVQCPARPAGHRRRPDRWIKIRNEYVWCDVVEFTQVMTEQDTSLNLNQILSDRATVESKNHGDCIIG